MFLMKGNIKIPSLRIGNLEALPPVIQGGMGVRVSGAGLAAAVANEGCMGTIASVGLGDTLDYTAVDFAKVNNEALRKEIQRARNLSNGIIGVNIMVAVSNFDHLVQTALDEKVDYIISGAGLPLDLPGFVSSSCDTKLIPIVSSGKAFSIIYKRWKKRFNKIPDAVIVEGNKAGGHLGFSMDELKNPRELEEIVREVIETVKSFDLDIPVVAAGGVYTGEDIVKYLKLGASGVQMATRFVCTEECDVHENFKRLYVQADTNDITIIKSPVGLPGRVIDSPFVQKIKNGETVPFRCKYRCLKSCDPKTAPFCIAKVLAQAAQGKFEEAFAFAGSNAYQCKEIVSVKKLVGQLKEEIMQALMTAEQLKMDSK